MSGAGADALDEDGEHYLHFFKVVGQLLKRLFIHVVEVMSQNEMMLKFAG